MSTPRQIVRAINAHCDKGNGIYVQWPKDDQYNARTVRCFRAKEIKGPFDEPSCAYVTPDFGKTWCRIEEGVIFSDGNWNAPIPGLPTKRN